MSPEDSGKKVKLVTLGCRLNFFESDGIFSDLRKQNYTLAEKSQSPDVVIINTCTVTSKADSKNRNIIRKAIAENPGSEVWVTGCYAETDREAIEKIPGIAGVVGNTQKANLSSMILRKNDAFLHNDRFTFSNVLPAGHTRAYLKIQDGCDRSCSYCKIPQARGKGISRSREDILEQVRFLQNEGVGEIILTGVNIGWFRNDEGKKSLPALISAILDELDYSRLRISSIEPPDVGSELAELLQHPRFCNYLHVPLQSGSKKILKSMKRSYFPETYISRITKLREKNPDIFIGTDVITGFPGESEEDFQDTLDVIRQSGIAKIHAFPYSERKGTPAASLAESIPVKIRKERVAVLNNLSAGLYRDYALSMQGRILQGILENDGTLVSDNYLKMRLGETELRGLKTGQFVDVMPTGVVDGEYVQVSTMIQA